MEPCTRHQFGGRIVNESIFFHIKKYFFSHRGIPENFDQARGGLFQINRGDSTIFEIQKGALASTTCKRNHRPEPLGIQYGLDNRTIHHSIQVDHNATVLIILCRWLITNSASNSKRQNFSCATERQQSDLGLSICQTRSLLTFSLKALDKLNFRLIFPQDEAPTCGERSIFTLPQAK